MIKIDDEYRINANENCYVLEKVSTIKDETSKNFGKEVKTIDGYYVSLESALRGYIKNKTRLYISNDTENTLKDLLNYIKELEDYLKNKLGKV